MEGNNPRPARRQLVRNSLTVAAVSLFFVLASLGDLAEVIPALFPLTNSFLFSILETVHELLALALVLFVTYRYNARAGITAGLAYFAFTLPFHIITPAETMETTHLIATAIAAGTGIWIVNLLQKSETKYRSLFTGMIEGMAYCKMIFKNGKPQDFVYLDVNDQFEKLTGLHNVVGKKITELVPGIRETNPELFEIYGRVASTGKPEMFETYVQGLDKWFSVSVYCPRKEHFTALFDVITKRKKAEEALMNSESNYRHLTNALEAANADLEVAQRLAKIGNWKWTVTNDEVQWSKELCLINGWEPGKVPPPFARMSSFYTPESWKRLNEAVARTYASGEPYDLELDLIRTDGSVIKTKTRGEADLDANGKVSNIHGTVQDITDSKLAEEQISHLANMLRTIRSIDQLITREKDRGQLVQKSCELLLQRQNLEEVWILLFDTTGNVIAGSSKTTRPESSAFLEELKAGHYPECMMQVLAPGKKFIAFQQPGTIHHGCVMSEQHSGKDTFRCKLEYDGQTYGVIGISCLTGTAFDIDERELFVELCGDISFALDSIRQETEREAAEEALRLNEENFRHSVDESPLGIRILDEQGKTVYANRAVLEMFGFKTFDELNTTPGAKIYTPEAYAKHRKRVEKRSRQEYVPPRYETSIVRPDGKIRHLDVFRSDVVWNGKPQFQQVYQDITEVKTLQEQLIMQDRLVSIGQLVSGVAHELNNPLTSVIGFSELLLQRQLPDDVKDDLRIVNEEAKRTSAIVKNLLTFARQQPQEKHPLQINEPVRSVLLLRNHEQSVNSIRVNTNFAPDLPLVVANSSQLQQVFFNLVTNAEFSMTEAHKKGTLTITTRRDGDFACVSITDDGPGIYPENMKRLFSPFFTTKELGKGTGLGLSICQGIISEHGGKIWAESEPGKGATFIVELPLCELSKGKNQDK